MTPGNSSPSQGEREGSSQGAGNRPLRKTDQQAQRATWTAAARGSGKHAAPWKGTGRPSDLLAMLGGILMERLQLSFSESKDFCVLFTDVFLEPCK